MRVAVIRDDLPGPVRLTDLEQVSRRNVSVDSPGQEGNLSPASVASIRAALAHPSTGVGAALVASGAPTSLTIGAGNKVLRVKTASAASFGVYTIAEADYASTDALVDAMNTAFRGTMVRAFRAGDAVALESTVHGEGSYLELDTVANGSTANTNLNLANGAVRTVPSAEDFYAATGLPEGPLTIDQATLEAVGATTSANALEPFYDAADPRAHVIANAVAPVFAETDVAIESFLVGNLAKYRSASYDPDPRRPSVPAGAAVAVFEDDGVTAFSEANTLPTLTSAVLADGAVTLTGTSIGTENGGGTAGYGLEVQLMGSGARKLQQRAIIAAGGSVLATSIVIPASLIPGVAVSTTSVRVQVRHRVSNALALS